jgi:hypothetical protein
MKDMFHIALATMDAVPNWLKADDAERLRSSIEAHRILDGEYQVRIHPAYVAPAAAAMCSPLACLVLQSHALRHAFLLVCRCQGAGS